MCVSLIITGKCLNTYFHVHSASSWSQQLHVMITLRSLQKWGSQEWLVLTNAWWVFLQSYTDYKYFKLCPSKIHLQSHVGKPASLVTCPACLKCFPSTTHLFPIQLPLKILTCTWFLLHHQQDYWSPKKQQGKFGKGLDLRAKSIYFHAWRGRFPGEKKRRKKKTKVYKKVPLTLLVCSWSGWRVMRKWGDQRD